MQAPRTVWFNKNISSTYQVIEILRCEQRAGELRLVCTHSHPHSPVLGLADVGDLEPKGLSDHDYIQYCLEFIRRHDVQVFVPGKRVSVISAEIARFEQAGVRMLVAAGSSTLHILNDKARTYRAVEGLSVPLPEYRVVNSLDAFDAAYTDLLARGFRVCFKPAASMFGLGFRIITEQGGNLKRMLSGDPLSIDLQDARRCFAESSKFRDVLVMQYLPGAERSVDCLAHAGELVCSVVRRKPDVAEGAQLLECNSPVEQMVRQLTQHLQLNGMFNVQFKDDGETPHLLEINPRMSGGLPMACLSGVAFPLWAIRLALGTATPLDVPHPSCGMRVKEVGRAVMI